MTSKSPPAGADLWILAGQSNMEGFGRFDQPFPEHPRLWAFDMEHIWTHAVPPMHHLFIAKSPAHRTRMLQNGATVEALDELAGQGRESTFPAVGPGYFFGLELLKHLPVDQHIALLPCAHGGSTLEEWMDYDPGTPGGSLYSAMIEQARSSGLQPRGVLWYQGESDRFVDMAASYASRFEQFVGRLRDDFSQPDLPVFTVQCAVIYVFEQDAVMDRVREAQRRIAHQVKRVYVTHGLDAEYDDTAHLDRVAQERLGQRLARQALKNVYGHPVGVNSPMLEKISVSLKSANHVRQFVPDYIFPRVCIEYRDVNGKLGSKDGPTGYSVRASSSDGPVIFPWKTELNPAEGGQVALWLPPLDETVKKILVSYGGGVDPYVNITDEYDMPLPAFLDYEVHL
jgi:hypothetical protein